MDLFRRRIADQLLGASNVAVHSLKRVRLLPSETDVISIWSHVPVTKIMPSADLPLQVTVSSIDARPPVHVLDCEGSETLEIPDIALSLLPADFTWPPASAFEVPIDKLPLVRVFGRNYADRYWTEYSPKDGSIIRPKPTRTRQKRRARKSDEQLPLSGPIQGERRQTDSFWDMLFVVLKPPITLGQTKDQQLPHDLYPYQLTGIKFLLDHPSALLADDMGTGKTVMTCVALKALMQQAQAHRALIICPPSILYQWEDHLHEWCPEFVTLLVRGGKETRQFDWLSDAHVYITTYDMLKGDMDNGLLPKHLLNSFDTVILDEAHHTKNYDSKRSKAVRCLQATRRWALTGTPIQNRVEDVCSIFAFVLPGLLDPHEQRTGYVRQKIAPYLIRRTKSQVLADLPPKVRQDVWLELDKDQRLQYELAERQAKTELGQYGDKVTKIHIFAMITRLKQICNFASGKATSPKVSALLDQIEDIIASGNKVIVFSQYIDQGLAKLAHSLQAYQPARIEGSLSDHDRQQQLELFKRNPDVSILLAAVRAAGEGLNLTEANYVIHFDHWWNPSVMFQAEDRVHRRGQTRGVNVYSYWMRGTIDERIHQLLQQKGLLIQSILEDRNEQAIEETFSTEELMGLIFGPRGHPEAKQPSRDWSKAGLEEIRAELLQISPYSFEHLVKNLMQSLGYQNPSVTSKSRDGGIDVIATRSGQRVAAQCKRYTNPVGVEVARELVGSLNDKRIQEGILVTTSVFTTECAEYCQRHHITMFDGYAVAKEVRRFGIAF